ncbi:hypothetical protein KIW84_062135 [Lathyrus oleraceus]|uniref:SAM-dependent MTase RsmB/NOP-type domain-containing protein n=1 Tax=Pisum sativum TaxID=3888 RepID=A0A9D4W637_PEA|nr:hypothetical protein KIW84_062135 [Pisum sativum]
MDSHDNHSARVHQTTTCKTTAPHHTYYDSYGFVFWSCCVFTCSVFFKVVSPVKMSFEIYATCVIPISAFFVSSLWFGNTPYLHISVAFIRMLKALMPVATFLVAVLCGIDKASFGFLFVPWYLLEKPMIEVSQIQFNFWIFFSNALCALALNFSIFLVIGRTGAVTIRVAESTIIGLNIIGYGIALCGVVMYNYMKVRDVRASQLTAESLPDRISKDWKLEKKSSDIYVPDNGSNNEGSSGGNGSASETNIDEETPLISSSSHAVSKNDDNVVLSGVGISNEVPRPSSEKIISDKPETPNIAAHGGDIAESLLNGLVYASKMPSKGTNDTIASSVGEIENGFESKTTAVLNRSPRMKLFKHAGSLNYKRMLPIFLEAMKSKSCASNNDHHPKVQKLLDHTPAAPISDSNLLVNLISASSDRVPMDDTRDSGAQKETELQACDLNNDSSSPRSQLPDKQILSNGLHTLQILVAMQGLSLLKVGGRMVYSTCSMNPIENEAVVAEILRRCKGSVELVDVSSELPQLIRRLGLKRWKVRDKGKSLVSCKEVDKVRRSAVLPSMFPNGGNYRDINCNCNCDVNGHPEDGVQVEENPAIHEFTEIVSDFPLELCMRLLPHDQNSGAFFIAVLRGLNFECFSDEVYACIKENSLSSLPKMIQAFVDVYGHSLPEGFMS